MLIAMRDRLKTNAPNLARFVFSSDYLDRAVALLL